MKPFIPIAAGLLALSGCTSTPPAPVAEKPAEVPGVGSVARLDPAFDALVPASAKIEKLAGGFTFIEGPLWLPEGHLWFSDVVGNVVRQWSPDGKVVEILKPGGYDGTDLPAGRVHRPQRHDRRTRTARCCSASTAIAASCASPRTGRSPRWSTSSRARASTARTTWCIKSDGSLYFTDPPYGLPEQDEDKKKELKFNGVFRLADGKLTVLVKDMTRPNGIAFSPDEKTLYVANSDPEKKSLDALRRAADGTVANGKVFFDVTQRKKTVCPTA